MATQRSACTTSARLKLALDALLLVAFVAANLPRLTGLTNHEWFGLLFVVPLLGHLLLDWPWIAQVTLRSLRGLPPETRANHVWDVLLYVVMVVVMLSGVLISRAALPALGLDLHLGRAWVAVHRLTADALMVMIGVHLALHARWIASSVRRYLLRAPRPAPRPGRMEGEPS